MDERQKHFDELYSSAIAAAQAGDIAKGEKLFSQAATFAPEKWCDLATSLARNGEDIAALDHFRLALQICPNQQIRAGIYNNIATIYARRGQLEDAIQLIDQARAADPCAPDAIVNLAQIRKWQGNIEASNRYADQALRLNPWHDEGQFIKALNALDTGDYVRGWPAYECRWRNRTNKFRKMECDRPEWGGPGFKFHGKSPKRIFIYGEQGAGDIILMLRYAPMLRELGLWQSWAVKPGMASLVAPVVDHAFDDANIDFDYDCHLACASLPRAFGTTIETIPPSGYLPKPEPVWKLPGFNVGITWRGNSTQFNDSIRSTSLDVWMPVLSVPGVTFHSLQVDGSDEALLYPQIITHDPPNDWLESARRLASLDLLITVDTGIMHLAGAMNLPVLCALHCRPYFVFPITRPDTPWYSSVKLFKQKQPHQWKEVFHDIATQLAAITKIHRLDA